MKSQELLLTNDFDLEECYQTLKCCLSNTKHGLIVEVKENIQTRSKLQNAFYWRFNTKVGKFFKDAGCSYLLQGVKHEYNKDVIHGINKNQYGIETTKTMSIKDFVDYLEELQSFWREKTNGFYVHDESVRKEAEKWKKLE